MTNRQVIVGVLRAALLSSSLLWGTSFAVAQTQPAPPSENERKEDMQHGQHAWDEFLGKHPELREQMIKDPNIVNDPAFRAQHPEMDEFMKNHPGVARDLKKDPNAVMRHSRHYARDHHAGERHPGNKGKAPQHTK